MKTVKIIELLEGNTYKVWHDFEKEEITREELENVMDRLAGRGRIVRIKDYEVFCCLFDDEKLIEVEYMMWIWENCPESYLKDVYEDIKIYESDEDKPFWALIERQCEFAYKGYDIDAPFDGGAGVFQYLGFE